MNQQNNQVSSPEFYAQFGEDRILNEIFRDKLTGFCVEVGAYDGIAGSNTYFFEKKGWDCLLVEPVPEFYSRIQKNRKCKMVNKAASSEAGSLTFYIAKNAETLSTANLDKLQADRIQAEGGQLEEIRVERETLNSILSRQGNVQSIDFITIDVEGHELEVLRGFDLERYQPRVLVIEDIWNGGEPRLHDYLERYGYVCFKRTGCNDWFAKNGDVFLVKKSDVQSLKNWRERQQKWRKIFNSQFIAYIKTKIPTRLKNQIKSFLSV